MAHCKAPILRRNIVRGLVTSLLSVVVGVSCASTFEPGSKISTFRVLAVQKDKPYARPGDTVHLSMLLDDGLPPPKDGQRDVHVKWLRGCENPIGDAYAECFSGKHELDTLPPSGLEVTVALTPDIIRSRPPPVNPAQPRYGSAFVFFAACAGGDPTVDQSEADKGRNPFVCKSPSGKLLGPDNFVIGYTEIFAYESFTNANPLVTGFELDGMSVTPDCIGNACIALERAEQGVPPAGPMGAGGMPGSMPDGAAPVTDAGVRGDAASDAGPSPIASDAGPMTMADAGSSGTGSHDGGSGMSHPDAGLPPPACDGGDPRCIDVCTTDDQDTCEKHTVKLVVDQRSAEHDAAQEVIQGGTILEQMWINYYADAGKLEHDVKLLNDATVGWNEAHSADLRTPLDIKPFHVWAVAHDNRGGAQWARVTLATRVPANGFP